MMTRIAGVSDEEAGVRHGASIMVHGTKVTKGGAAFANSEMAMAGGKLDSFRMLTHPGTILEGSGAYTAVEGERVYMEPGDLVLTPNWQWHDHGNETDHPVVWLDGLDIPLVRSLNTMFFERYTARQVPATKPVNASKALYGYGRLSPTWVQERPQSSPLLLYAWDQTLEALRALRDHEGSPYEGIALEYTHPQTGGPCLPTIGCHVQLIRPGEHLQARRTTGSPERAPRACYAALAMQAAMQPITEAVRRTRGLELRLRVGLKPPALLSWRIS
jgi:cupin domain